MYPLRQLFQNGKERKRKEKEASTPTAARRMCPWRQQPGALVAQPLNSSTDVKDKRGKKRIENK